MNILNKILQTKQQEIANIKQQVSLIELKNASQHQRKPRNFVAALLHNINAKRPAIIAEIKKASPSKGVIRADFDPAQLASAYQAGGASCLSVLTDKLYFQGADEFLIIAKNACDLPVLRKDFIIDEYQIYQSFMLGADCILLIVAVFKDDGLMRYLSDLAQSLGMAVLVEVHNKAELARALILNLPIIGINNRNLKTFKITLQTTIDLLQYMPDNTAIITESAIVTHQDIITMQNHKVYGFLVGESLMRQDNVQIALKTLING